MGYGITIDVWGDYALFTRPEMKVERVSYDVMTPSAAVGILEAVYWKPAIKWVIDKIHVMNQIKFDNIKRNEVDCKASTHNFTSAKKSNSPCYIDIEDRRQQRSSLVLKDVRYIIEAHFELTKKAEPTETEKKHYNVMLRRLRKGQNFHTPYFGCREFTANVNILETTIPKSQLSGTVDLGWMLYAMDFNNGNTVTTDYNSIKPMFFRPTMTDGIIDLTGVSL